MQDRIASLLLGIVTTSLMACSGQHIQTVKKPKVFKVATQKWAPELVYNRLRWVRPPQVNPDRAVPTTASAVILPIIHFSVEKETLKDAVLILGASSRYKTFCSPAIEDQLLSLEMLGTIEEIAVAIEDTKNIQVIVDHNAEQLRFEPRVLL